MDLTCNENGSLMGHIMGHISDLWPWTFQRPGHADQTWEVPNQRTSNIYINFILGYGQSPVYKVCDRRITRVRNPIYHQPYMHIISNEITSIYKSWATQTLFITMYNRLLRYFDHIMWREDECKSLVNVAEEDLPLNK